VQNANTKGQGWILPVALLIIILIVVVFLFLRRRPVE